MSYTDSSRSWCGVCEGMEWLPADIAYSRERICTCGAGDPRDPMVMHAISCDAVPCPFCQLCSETAFQEV